MTNPEAKNLDPVPVAYQGEPGAFSEEALHAALPSDAIHPTPRAWFPDVAEAVGRGETPLGLLPVENSLAGSVTDSYDLLAEGDLTVVAELVHPIRLVVMGLPGARMEDLKRVLSHPVALAQCTGFLARKGAPEAVAVTDTAGAARQAAEAGDPEVGAIAGMGAARRYELTPLAQDVQNRSDNRTRFYLVCRKGMEKRIPFTLPAPTRTAVALEVPHEPGALMGILEPFARRGVNLTRLESRPAGVPWRYRFFLEFMGSATSPEAEAALQEVASRASRLEVLGTFPTLGEPEAGPAGATDPGPGESAAES